MKGNKPGFPCALVQRAASIQHRPPLLEKDVFYEGGLTSEAYAQE